jgi:hypothetical protein
MGNTEQKARIEAMKREIERRGGVVGAITGVPDDILEIFLSQVLECPCCNGQDDGEDELDPFVPRRRGGHGH